MEYSQERFEAFKEFFERKGNENIDAKPSLPREDGPNGYIVDIDSFTEEQIKEFAEIDRKYPIQ